VTGSTITLVGAGSTTFSATQAADVNYTSTNTTTTLIIADDPRCFNAGTIVYNFIDPYYSCSCASGWTGERCEHFSP